MSCLSLGNCGTCWEKNCVCGRDNYTTTRLEGLRTDELEALQTQISSILAKRKQSITYSTNTTAKVIDRSHHTVIKPLEGNPFSVLASKHKD